MVKWTTANMLQQRGRVAVVTGTGGLGFEDALALAKAGAEVIIAGRSPLKGKDAVEQLHDRVPSANVRFEILDLASLTSIDAFARRLRNQTDKLDILINNAGVMVPPKRLETEDGFELQLGTNYLGHFALTGRLLPLLKTSRSARVVSLSSVAARQGRIDFADLNAQKRYRPMPVYSQSKLACLMFALELHRRSLANSWGVSSFCAHPGIARTDLLHNAPGRGSLTGLVRSALWFLFQPVWQGALPTLFAAAAPVARPGAYYGPDGLGETRGYPALARIPAQATDKVAMARLWDVSEALTGVQFDSTTVHSV